MVEQNHLVQLSNREDIDTLYKKYGNRSELYFVDSIEGLTIDYQVWMAFHQGKQYNLIDLYRTMLRPAMDSINQVLERHRQIFEVSSIQKSVEDYLGENISTFSDEVIMTESKHLGFEIDDYLIYLAENEFAFKSLVEKYSYWYHLIQNFLTESQQFLAEFLTNLAKDRQKVMENFFGKVTKVQNIKLLLGDKHRGKFVIEVESPGGHFFYKPRPAVMEQTFQKCWDELSNVPNILPMRTPEFVSFEDYAYFKEVKYMPVLNLEEKARYYQRLGQLIALLYILNGTDIHFENLISQGEYPVIVDNETLLTSRLSLKKRSTPAPLQTNDLGVAFDSVRNSMILPDIITTSRDKRFNLSPFNYYNDNVENFEDEKIKIHAVENDEIESITENVLLGFQVVYQEIAQHKSHYRDLFSKIFAGMRLRFLNKPTMEYSEIRNLLRNPVCFFDASISFALSARLFEPGETNIKEEELFEQAELLKFDIPYFEVKFDSKDLILTDNRIISNFFVETPLEGMCFKLDLLGPADYERNKYTIMEMFRVIRPDFVVKELSEASIAEMSSKIDEKFVLDKIDQIIQYIFKKRLVNPLNQQYFWIGPELEGDVESGDTVYRAVEYPNSFYMGGRGILRGLLQIDYDGRYQAEINKLISDTEYELNLVLMQQGEMNLGAYNGLADFIRYYSTLYRYGRLSYSKLVQQVDKLVDSINLGLHQDKKLDILDGLAGVSLALMDVRQYIKDQKLNSKIINQLEQCREHLIAAVKHQEGEHFFPLMQDPKKYLTGFAHGSAGIITTLYKISRILHQTDDNLIKKLLTTERRHYDKQQAVWYRGNQDSVVSWGWCHGIPGILLSRIELYKDGYRDSMILDEIMELYEATLVKSLGHNLTYCHGDFGNLVICKHVEEALNLEDDRINTYLKELYPYLLQADQELVRGTEMIGLMTGVMGLATFLDGFFIKKDITEMIDILKISSI